MKAFDPVRTVMVGVTWRRDPVWKLGNGRPFLLTPAGVMQPFRWPFRYPKRWGYRRLAEPHLTYLQVELASEKSRVLLSELKRGPLKLKKGFMHNPALGFRITNEGRRFAKSIS